MKKYLLKYSFIIVLLGVELYARHFLIKNDLYDPNSFFINWGLVWLFLLSLSLLGNGASKSLRVGGCISNMDFTDDQTTSSVERSHLVYELSEAYKKNKNARNIKLFKLKPNLLILITLVIGNGIAHIIIV